MRVEQIRGGVVEAVHEVHVAVVDSTGGLVARTGDPELVTFWRSAAKPFQALPLLEDGAAARFGLTSEELALACASHSSEPDQVARVRELLGETCRYARTGAPPRLAHGVLYAARAPRAAALPRGGESLDGGRGRRHPNRRGWMRSRVLRAAAAKHGAGVRETCDCGFRIADCGFERRASNPQSAIRNRGIDVAPPRSHRR